MFAFAGRYGHQPIDVLERMDRRDLALFCGALDNWLQIEYAKADAPMQDE